MSNAENKFADAEYQIKEICDRIKKINLEYRSICQDIKAMLKSYRNQASLEEPKYKLMKISVEKLWSYIKSWKKK